MQGPPLGSTAFASRRRYEEYMSQPVRSQVLCGPFLPADIPDKDASIMHIMVHWKPYISDADFDILMFVWSRTTRFATRVADISFIEFTDGKAPNPLSGFAGIPPVLRSKTAIYRSIRELTAYGVLNRSSEGLALDYSIIATDLATHEAVQKRVIAAHRNHEHGPVDGDDAMEFVQSVMLRLSPLAGNKQCQLEGTPKSTQEEIQTTRVLAPTRAAHKGFETVAEALAHAKKLKEDHLTKRRVRGNITDYGKLFQDAWHTAVRERFPGTVVSPWSQTRVIPNLKRTVLVPAREAGIEAETLARFIVKNWQRIRKKKISWAKQYPAKPEIGFVMLRANDYLEAFTSGMDDAVEDTIVSNEEANQRIKKLEAELARKDASIVELKKTTLKVVEEQASEIRKLRRIKPRPVSKEAAKSLLDMDYDQRVMGKIK